MMRWNSKTMNNIKNKLKWIKFNLCPVFFFLFVSFEICSVERKRMFIFPKLLQCQHILKKLCSDIFFYSSVFASLHIASRKSPHYSRNVSGKQKSILYRRAKHILAGNQNDVLWFNTSGPSADEYSFLASSELSP